MYVSVVALVSAVAAYCHCLYRHHHYHSLQVATIILPVVWHISLVLARLATFVMFAAVYQIWIFLVLGLYSMW